ncbi:hypothetical protein [Bacillus rubiinfantis]|nr:hypothetical protein [Bacillus rubiinfantis]
MLKNPIFVDKGVESVDKQLGIVENRRFYVDGVRKIVERSL